MSTIVFNQAVHYKGHIFVVILTVISNYFKTLRMPVVSLQNICLSGHGLSNHTTNDSNNYKIIISLFHLRNLKKLFM